MRSASNKTLTRPFIAPIILRFATAAVLLLASLPPAAADERSWIPSSGGWSEAGNWSGNEPTENDNAKISNGGTASVALPGEICSNLFLGVTSSGTGTGAVQITGGNFSTTTGYVGYTGVGDIDQSAGTANFYQLELAFQIGTKGTYELGGSGQLKNAASEYVGHRGEGTFTHSAGTNATGGLSLGTTAFGNGTYELNGPGQLSSTNEQIIGDFGRGTFRQTAGSNHCGGNFYMAYGPSTRGTYELSGVGSELIFAKDVYIGYTGQGTFTNSAINRLECDSSQHRSFYLGYFADGSGTYNLSGDGQLRTVYGGMEEYVGYSGEGTFNQTGGINNPNGNFVYRLSARQQWVVLAQRRRNELLGEDIGRSGTGIFTQTGGTNNAEVLSLGYNSGASGTYHLSGGTLKSGLAYIGAGGTAIFNQSGGTHIVTDELSVGYFSPGGGYGGTYNLTGGTLTLKSMVSYSSLSAFNFGGGTLQAGGPFHCLVPMKLTGDGGNASLDTAACAVSLSGLLSGPGGLKKLGDGTLTLTASNSYGGDTSVLGGVLIIAGGIDPGGTKRLDVQAGTTKFETTAVIKPNLNIHTAQGAALEIASGTHVLGNITGGGILKIDDGASLTATSIVQDTLIIGGAESAAPLAVPEPSTYSLLAVFVTLAAVLGVRSGPKGRTMRALGNAQGKGDFQNWKP